MAIIKPVAFLGVLISLSMFQDKYLLDVFYG